MRYDKKSKLAICNICSILHMVTMSSVCDSGMSTIEIWKIFQKFKKGSKKRIQDPNEHLSSQLHFGSTDTADYYSNERSVIFKWNIRYQLKVPLWNISIIITVNRNSFILVVLATAFQFKFNFPRLMQYFNSCRLS